MQWIFKPDSVSLQAIWVQRPTSNSMLGSTRAVAKDQERAPQEWRGKDQRLGQLTGCLLLRSASSDFGVMLAICCRIHPWKHAHLAKNQCSRLLRTYIEHALLLVTAQCPLFSLHASLHCTPEQCLHVQTMETHTVPSSYRSLSAVPLPSGLNQLESGKGSLLSPYFVVLVMTCIDHGVKRTYSPVQKA